MTLASTPTVSAPAVAPVTIPVAPASVRDAIAAARNTTEWTAFYYRPANAAEPRPAVLAAIRHRAKGKGRIERKHWSGSVDRKGHVQELLVSDWNEFANLAAGSTIVSHPLLGIVAPAMNGELARLARTSPEGKAVAARIRALGPRADLLEIVSFLRDPVAPWARSSALDASDRRSVWAHGEGRALLGRLAALESLSLSAIAALLIPNLAIPANANAIERKTIAIDALWPLFSSALVAFDGSFEVPVETEPVLVTAPVRLVKADALPVAEIARRAHVSLPVAAMLASRGLDDPEELARRVSPDPDRESPNPYGLVGMAASAERIRRAVNTRESILIFGDYDADGLGGTAVLGNFLREAGAKLSTLVGRREHGYGLLMESAAAIMRDYDPGLVITIDCGTSNHDSIAYLQSCGVDVVVLDHHLALKGNPPTPYFVNPKREDELYGFREFCGCGVAYKMVQALSTNRHEPALYELVAMSTIADHMIIAGENRFFVSQGLRNMRGVGQANLGLAALARAAGRPVAGLSERDFSFTLAPRINAVGRMHADPNQVVSLLMSNDHAEADKLAVGMESLNTERKRLTDELIVRAIEDIGPNPPDFIVSFLPNAGIGVAGLIAGHLVTRYNRPVLVVNEYGRGSGRSPNSGTPIKTYLERLQANPKLANLEFGGHAHAAGFAGVDPKTLVEVSRTVRVPSHGPVHLAVRAADADLPVRMIGSTLVRELFEAEPLLAGDNEPLFRIPNVHISEAARTIGRDGKPSEHLRLRLIDDADGATATAYWFGAGNQLDRIPEHADIYGIPTEGRYRAGDSVFRVERVTKPAAR